MNKQKSRYNTLIIMIAKIIKEKPLFFITLRQFRCVPYVTVPMGIGSVIKKSFGSKYMCDSRTSGRI